MNGNGRTRRDVPLYDLIAEAQPGFACGARDERGTLQVRMNNVVGDGGLDFTSTCRVPITSHQREKYRLWEGDVLFNQTNSPNLVGKTALFSGSDEPVVFSNHFLRLRTRPDRLEPSYLAHWLAYQWRQRRFEHLCVQWVNQATVRREDLLQLEMPLPPTSEQRRIAAILDKADALRRKRREAIAKLDALVQSVFLEMFGDPTANHKRWERFPVEHFGVVTTGNTPSRARGDYYGPGIEWIKSDNINTPLHFLTPAAETLTEAGRSVGRVVSAGSVLVTCIAGSRQCIGNAAIADREVAFNQQINAIAPTNPFDSAFLYVQLLVAKILVQRASTDSMKGMVSKTAFCRVQFVCPPEELRRAFSKRFEAIQCLHRKASTAARSAEHLSLSAQQRAFDGRLLAAPPRRMSQPCLTFPS